MNFSKKHNKTINSFRTKKTIKTLASSLFLMFLIISSCSPSDPDFEYNVTFLSPNESAIYYTDTLNEVGESLGAEIVEIKAEITTNTELRSLGIQIRNSSLQIINEETFDNVEDLLEYTIETTFQTDIAGFYYVYVISTYGYGQNSFVRIWQSSAFEYKDLVDNGEGGNTD